MKNSLLLGTYTGLVSAIQSEVYLPHKAHDLKLWRTIPLLPQVFIENELRYIMFANDTDDYVITVKGRFDNNNGLPIEADGIHRIARGFFFQDATYGFDSLDGFVVYWDNINDKWKFTSLLIYSQFYVHDQTDLDLTYEASNGEWYCETRIDPNPRPKYDEAICSRIVPEKTEWETRHISY